MITVEEVLKARDTIKDYIVETPFLLSNTMTDHLRSKVFIKYENLQTTGSFKLRGAANKLIHIQNETGDAGVIAASAGNHAQGMALMSSLLNIPCTIVMPQGTPLIKISKAKGYGANVILFGENVDAAYEHAMKIVKDTGATMVHPWNDEQIMAGQGTCGLEIVEQATKPLDILVVPVGGGGLMTGISTVFRAKSPKTRIVGVQVENYPNVGNAIKDPSRHHEIITRPTIAEGIAIKDPTPRVATYLNEKIDDVVFVTEEEVSSSVLYLLEKVKTVSEGAGAAAVAALLSGKVTAKKGERVGIVLTGGNVDPHLLGSIIDKGLSKAGRMCGLRFICEDRPGNLMKICKVVAEHNANILQVYHHRDSPSIQLMETEIEVHLETRGPNHQATLIEALESCGLTPKKLF